MRKLIILAALAYAGYGYFTGTLDLPLPASLLANPSPVISNDNPGGRISVTGGVEQAPAPVSNRTFTCDGRQHCSQMSSYEEASFFLANCPNTKMDGDNDGIPCEQQFPRWHQ